MLMICMT